MQNNNCFLFYGNKTQKENKMQKKFIVDIKEYSRLSRNVRIARRNSRNARKNITVNLEAINLNEPEQQHGTCICHYDCVIAGNSAVFTPYETYCELFQKTEFCGNRKCPKFALNVEYVAARDRYDNEVKLRREFRKNLLRRQR